MKITVLLENATPTDRFCAKHGLSMFIELDGKSILFDMGPDGSFIENAKAMGVDVLAADFAVISHGHYDHGGGLRAYLEATEAAGKKALVYVHERAFEDHCANTPRGLKDIGLDPGLLEEYADRFVLVGDAFEIGEGLSLFAAVEMEELAPVSNRVLLERVGAADAAAGDAAGDAAAGVAAAGDAATAPAGAAAPAGDAATAPAGDAANFAPDAFAHEQSLLINEGGKVTLITGCSHCGIVNIMKKAEGLLGAPLHAVVAGFHLMNPATGEVEDLGVAKQVAQMMAERPTKYCTFHCTGLAAYSVLRDVLGEQVSYLYTGSRIEV